MTINGAAPVRPSYQASYELVHRFWMIHARVGAEELTAYADWLGDVEPTIRAQIATATHDPSNAFDVELTHVLQPDVHPLVAAPTTRLVSRSR
jgi:hypothetical protein